ncbi:MAG: class I SAM-dependent methyltransferase [Thermoguttaceae bacterium]
MKKPAWYDMERLAPNQWTFPWVRHQHWTRYHWACQFVQGASVIGAACGHGYGSIILAKGGAQKVQGFDICEEVVEQTQQTYRHQLEASFHVADVRQLSVSDNSCDVYISFETIEHIADDFAFLAEAARVIRPGGKFICSTPNRDLFDPGTSLTDAPHNPFHIRGYVQEEFHNLLASFFPKIDWFGQSWYSDSYCRRLTTLGRRHPKIATMVHQLRELCGVASRGAAAHTPQPIQAGQIPEIWIAVCTADQS